MKIMEFVTKDQITQKFCGYDVTIRKGAKVVPGPKDGKGLDTFILAYKSDIPEMAPLSIFAHDWKYHFVYIDRSNLVEV